MSKKRKSASRIAFIIVSVLLLVSMILGFVIMLFPPTY